MERRAELRFLTKLIRHVVVTQVKNSSKCLWLKCKERFVKTYKHQQLNFAIVRLEHRIHQEFEQSTAVFQLSHENTMKEQLARVKLNGQLLAEAEKTIGNFYALNISERKIRL